MRRAMINAMAFWLDSVGIDGFRCDVAGEVPTDFWNEAFGELRLSHHDLFTLAEDEDKAQELTESAFDMYYGWTLHHLMNDVAQGHKTVQDLWDYFAKADTTIRPEAIRMNFTSNHDENSWNGTEFERMGDAAHLFAAFTYVVPGMPLIYTGQMSGNHHRLAFFDKDTIDVDNNALEHNLYTGLNTLREKNIALWSPEVGAPMYRLDCDNDKVFACVRPYKCEKSNYENNVIAVMNMSSDVQVVNVEVGEYEGRYTCICGKKMRLSHIQEFTLEPWSYLIFSNL